jgi:hypothetical protein
MAEVARSNNQGNYDELGTLLIRSTHTKLSCGHEAISLIRQLFPKLQ